LKWLLPLLAALAVITTVVLYNPGLVRGPLERYLSGVTGYAISLGGELEINPGRQTEIIARNIHVSAPDRAGRDDLVYAGLIDLKLNTASLFKDIVLIESLQVDKLRLNLETDADGTGNWITARRSASAHDIDAEKTGDKTILVFNNLQVRESSVRFLDGQKGVENVFNIESLDHRQQVDGMLHSTLLGELNKRPVEYTQTVGPYKNLLEGRDIRFSANGHIGELVIKGDARIDSLLEPRQPEFNFDLQGPNIDKITAMLGIADLGGGGFSLRARGGQVNGSYKAGVNGKVGDVSLDVEAQASDITHLNELDLTTEFTGPRLGRFLSVFNINNWPDKPFALKGAVKRVGSTLDISDVTLDIGDTNFMLDARLNDFPGLANSQVKLMLSGDDIAQFRELFNLPGIASGPFSLKGTLTPTDGGLELLNVNIVNSLGRLALSGTLDSSAGYVGSKLKLRLEGYDANRTMSLFKLDILPPQPFILDAGFEVTQNALRVEHGTLLTIQETHLELGGFITLQAGGDGSELEVRLNGRHLANLLGKFNDRIGAPGLPYELSGRLLLKNGALQLQEVALDLEANHLQTDGTIGLGNGFSGTTLDFQIHGNDINSLGGFQKFAKPLDMLVPGQSYQASGRFLIDGSGLHFNSVQGRVGDTEINLEARISRQADAIASAIRFMLSGPDVNGFLQTKDAAELPAGQFETSGQISLSGNALNIDGFNFATASARGTADLELVWPLSSNNDASFNVKIQGEDIRNFLPHSDHFEAEKADFDVIAIGNKRGDILNIDEFRSTIGNLKIGLKGKTDIVHGSDNVEVDIDVESEDISTLGRLNGQPLPAMPLKISGDLVGDTKQFASHDLVVSFGESSLNGELNVSLQGARPDITLVATSDYLDLLPFMQTSASAEARETTTLQKDEPGQVSVPPSKPDRLIPDTAIPLDHLAAVDLTVKLEVAALRSLNQDFQDLRLDAVQKSGRLEVRRFSYESPRGNLSASLSIVPTGSGEADVKIDLDARDFILKKVDRNDQNLDALPRFKIIFQAEGQGSDLREVAGSLNGSLYMGSRGGNAENLDLSGMELFVLEEIFQLLIPNSRDKPDTHFSCIATNMAISDGLVKTNPALALTSDRLAMVVKGTLDLKTEEMNFNFNATPTNVTKINAGEILHPYILIGGTLTNPQVGVDPGKAALYSGAAYATAGISILAKGVIDRLGSLDPVCEKMLDSAPGDENP